MFYSKSVLQEGRIVNIGLPRLKNVSLHVKKRTKFAVHLTADDELKTFQVSEKQICILFQLHIDIFPPKNNKTNAGLSKGAGKDNKKHE